MTPEELFALLSDTTRLRCLLLLSKKRELCVCELCHVLESIQPKISRHLSYLRKSGVALDERKGQWVYYRLNPSIPDWAKQIIACTIKQLNECEPYRSDIKKIESLRNLC